MDDLAHHSRPIHSLRRKRKADQDDHSPSPVQQDSVNTPEPMLIDVQATPRCPADPSAAAPAAAWPIARASQGMTSSWPSPSAAAFLPQRAREGQPSPKRLRIDIPSSPPASPHRPRRGQRQASSRHLSRQRRAGETRDTGIVSATEPGPCRGSLLRTASLPALPSSRSVPVSPIDPAVVSPHIPPHQPPINRETLKELDLEAILRNPQLRHDLLFDSGLQFRPTSSRRKRDLADNYWLAIVRELECGCTCTTLDGSGRLAERRCACGVLQLPTERPMLAFSTGNMLTVRTPSRIRPLLHELLEVLVSIIQPMQQPSTRPPELLFPPPPQHPQFQQNIAHVAHLRQLLDPELIQQEIDHGLFDPSGVFQAIGDIIRCHCAPMRDAAVDQMVALARSCAPGGAGTKLDAVRAIRMCFEIMELMKLDVANHQLQTLRPYLVRTAAQYEIRTFQEARPNGQPKKLQATREWLRTAHRDLESSKSSLLSQRFLQPQASQQTRTTIAIVKAVVNLIFDPPAPPAAPVQPSPPASAPTSTTSTPTISSAPPLVNSRSHGSSSSSHSSSSFAGYPETFFLDYSRLATLSTDASDFTALYSLLMLYRQLVHSHMHRQSRTSAQARTLVSNDELLRLKKEIWEIGPPHLGLCFMQNRPRASGSSGSSSRSSSRHERERDREAEMRKWRADIGDVVLQVTRRATEPWPPQNSAAESTESELKAPDAHVLSLANNWAESNLRAGSPLSVILKKRIRECVEEAVLNIVLPSSSSPSSPSSPSSSSTPKTENTNAAPTSSGLEPLMPEIRHLAERAAKLVTIHGNVYGAMYALPSFLTGEDDDADVVALAAEAAAVPAPAAFPVPGPLPAPAVRSS
ncbi:Tcp11-domain-containing protein [Lentinus brumalis]|uniref:Tcp11-domain-containing protein n=1 Tax=Lentinus brumalis TaxID=2498619 RepID=A0A371DLC0_9APHY|nr:Tcp11-domain-containing protein [Polyporus brumalis]